MVDKIKLVTIAGANNTANMNANFEKIEKAINNKLFSRKAEVGEVNQMESNMDMNHKRIYNLPPPQSPTEPLTAEYVMDLTSVVEQGQEVLQEARVILVEAKEANTEAMQILEDTHIKLDDALQQIDDKTQEGLDLLSGASAGVIQDVTIKHAEIMGKAVEVANNTLIVQQKAGEAQSSAIQAGLSASAASLSATNAQGASTAATSSAAMAKAAEESALLHVNDSAASAAVSQASADASEVSKIAAEDAADRATTISQTLAGGTIGFDASSYDFGLVRDTTTYFNRDFGTLV